MGTDPWCCAFLCVLSVLARERSLIASSVSGNLFVHTLCCVQKLAREHLLASTVSGTRFGRRPRLRTCFWYSTDVKWQTAMVWGVSFGLRFDDW